MADWWQRPWRDTTAIAAGVNLLLTPAQLILVRRALRELEGEWKEAHGREGSVLRR